MLTHVSATVLANLAATVLSIPLIVAVGVLAYGTRSFSFVPFGVALLVGILPSPTMAGVQVIAFALVNNDYLSMRDHWRGIRRYAYTATIAWLLSLMITAVILGNLAFYARAAGTSSGTLQTLSLPLFLLWLLICIPWIGMHLYVFPLLIRQEVKSIRLIYRNAFLMVVARPGVLAVVLPMWLALLLLSTITGLATFIGLALSAAIQHNTTARLLPTFRLSETS